MEGNILGGAQGDAREPVAKQLLAEGDGLRGGKHCKKKSAMSKNVFCNVSRACEKQKMQCRKTKRACSNFAFFPMFFRGGRATGGGVNTAKK